VAIEERYQTLTEQRGSLVTAAEDARAQLDEHAVQSFLRGEDAGLATMLAATDANDAMRRRAIVRSVLDEDERQLVASQQRLEEATAELRRLVEARTDARRRHRNVAGLLRRANEHVERARFEVVTYETGSHIAVAGFVFPVAEPTSFHDGWGDPRMPDTVYAHWHEGTDIMAAAGTELLAVERGRITKITSSVLGGLSVWLEGASGVHYYYAHLSRYEEGLSPGAEVLPGDIVGYVGDTGNARGTPHLHFEIHVDGRPINPYPILRVAWELRVRALELAEEEVPDVTTAPLDSPTLAAAP
jgi:murein DD-endopeptidase MepM/ murein hydrolase activator NlpD